MPARRWGSTSSSTGPVRPSGSAWRRSAIRTLEPGGRGAAERTEGRRRVGIRRAAGGGNVVGGSRGAAPQAFPCVAKEDHVLPFGVQGVGKGADGLRRSLG